MLSSTDLHMPPEWIGESRTLTQVQRERNARKKAHNTYDLDHDGTVSQQDFKLSYFFDRDKDGRLNTQERNRAEEAIKSGEANLLLEPRIKWPYNREPLEIIHTEYDGSPELKLRTQTELCKRRHEEIVRAY